VQVSLVRQVVVLQPRSSKHLQATLESLTIHTSVRSFLTPHVRHSSAASGSRSHSQPDPWSVLGSTFSQSMRRTTRRLGRGRLSSLCLLSLSQAIPTAEANPTVIAMSRASPRRCQSGPLRKSY